VVKVRSVEEEGEGGRGLPGGGKRRKKSERAARPRRKPGIAGV